MCCQSELHHPCDLSHPCDLNVRRGVCHQGKRSSEELLMGAMKITDRPCVGHAALQLANRFSCVALNQTVANVLNWCLFLSLPSFLFTRPPTPSHTHLLVQRQANLTHRFFASSHFIPSTLSICKPPPTPFLAFLITSLFPHHIQGPVQGHQRMLSSFQIKKNFTSFCC